MKRTLKWIVVLAGVWIAIEAIAFAGLAALKRAHGVDYEPIDVVSDSHKRILAGVVNGASPYKVPSPALGWTIKSHAEAESYETNSLGMRGAREYSTTPPADRVRIAAFGDSFTWGSGVGYAATWPAILEQRQPGVETMNFGVGGYGLDQAFLRYQQDGKAYQPHIVLIGYMTENIYRHVNTFRPFYIRQAGAPYAKPRFILVGDELSLVPNPVRKTEDYASIIGGSHVLLEVLGEHDFYYSNHYKSGPLDFSAAVRATKIGVHQIRRRFVQPIVTDGSYNTNSEAYRVTTALFRQFYCDAIMAGSLPIILVFPHGADVVRGLRKGEKGYLPLLDEFDRKGHLYIDLLSAFEDPNKHVDWTRLVRGHYTEQGNTQVARRIAEYLRAGNLNSLPGVNSARLVEQRKHQNCKPTNEAMTSRVSPYP